MSRWWRKRAIRPCVLVASVLCAVPLGMAAPLSASASSVAVPPIGAPRPAAIGPQPAAESPGHSPVPVFSAGYSVSCVRVTYCLAVGAYTANDVPRVLTASWNGSSWSVLPSPNPRNSAFGALNAVSCSNASHCLAVGTYTDPNYMTWGFSELWNGAAWSVVDTPTPSGGTFVGLSGISCASASYCVAVGSYTNHRSAQVTLTEFWNGAAWSIGASRNPGSSSSLSAVSCSSESACMATGVAFDADSNEVPLAESWSGTSWSVVGTPAPAGAQGVFLDGVSCPRSSRCMAVGNYADSDGISETVAESWNGTSWSVVASPTPSGSPNSDLFGISCATASRCLAVGHSYSPSAAAKDGALAESWDGSSWSTVGSPGPSATSALHGVSCATPHRCLAVGLFSNSSGDYQTLAETWDGSSLSIVNQDAVLSGVACLDASDCIAVGSHISGGLVSATLAESWNGRSWQTMSSPDPKRSQGSYLNAVTCSSTSRCVAVGYYYKRDNSRGTLIESWNGVRWSIVRSPNRPGAAYSVLYGISCVMPSQCEAVGSAGARVLAERWDGAQWSIVPSADPPNPAYAELADISCSSAVHCLAVGYETDIHYHADLPLTERWNGSTWSIVPSAAPGKNSVRASVLHAMSCTATGGCLAVGFHERRSGTLATFTERWTGKRWVAVRSPSPSGSSYSTLTAISCVSDDGCLAVGNYYNQAGNFATLSERWTGTKWRVVVSSTSARPSRISYLLDVSCAASFTCLATGTQGNPVDLDTLTEQLWNGSRESPR